MEKNLNIIYRLIPFLNTQRRKSIIELISYKSDKVQLLFENVSNPMNVVIIEII
jgi:hypothetical protein